MAGGRLLIPAADPVVNTNGSPVAGATLTVYENRTTNLAAIFTDAALTTPAANPQSGVNASNAAGYFYAQSRNLWADTAALYTIKLTFPTGQVYTYDDLSVIIPVFDASAVLFTQLGAGAVQRAMQDKLRERVNILDYIPTAKHNTILNFTNTDDLAGYIQDAIDTGFDLEFCGQVHANNLVQATNQQRFYATSRTLLVKNANGPLLTCSADDVFLQGLFLRGSIDDPATQGGAADYTGDGLVITGNRPILLSCGSMWSAGRALKATGQAVRVFFTNGIWQTVDAAGWDVEIGQTGVATLYHELWGIYTSQPTAGIKLIATGAAGIQGGQFGGLTISAGGNPAGSGGNKIAGARITGDVSVGLPSTIFNSNAFAAVDIVFEVGTSGCVLDESNVLSAGHTITNSGNGNNIIVRNVSAATKPTLRYGDDVTHIDIDYNQGDKFRLPQGLKIGNNQTVVFENASAGSGATFSVSAAGDVFVTGNVSGRGVVFTSTGASSYFRFDVNGTTGDLTIGDAQGCQVGRAAGKVSFYGANGVTKQAITGSRGANAAVADLLTKLATLGLITDSTTV